MLSEPGKVRPLLVRPPSEMKKNKSHILRRFALSMARWWWVAAIAAALVAVAYIYKGVTDNPPISLHVERNTTIDLTPERIQSIRDVGQWEFVSINDEEMVEWTRSRTFVTDRLVRIYQGTLRLGVDLSKAQGDWVVSLPDSTVRVTLPPVGLLDEHFIDEARSRTFYEHGSVPTDAADVLYAQAVEKMKRRCLTTQNLQAAEHAARREFDRVFRTLGFKKVIINFEKQ